MFNDWKSDRATQALVTEAQDMADRLATGKAHFLESKAAHGRLWLARYRAEGNDLASMADWPPARVTKMASALKTKVAALRKARDYDLADGLALWLHTARAVTEPRIAPAVCEIWAHVTQAGINADSVAEDLFADSGLEDPGRICPKGFAPPDED